MNSELEQFLSYWKEIEEVAMARLIVYRQLLSIILGERSDPRYNWFNGWAALTVNSLKYITKDEVCFRYIESEFDNGTEFIIPVSLIFSDNWEDKMKKEIWAYKDLQDDKARTRDRDNNQREIEVLRELINKYPKEACDLVEYGDY